MGFRGAKPTEIFWKYVQICIYSKICAFVQKYAFMFEICIYMRFGKCCSRGAVSLGLFNEHKWLPIKNMQICVYMRNPSSADDSPILTINQNINKCCWCNLVIGKILPIKRLHQQYTMHERRVEPSMRWSSLVDGDEKVPK